jgi:hypothetical protein
MQYPSVSRFAIFGLYFLMTGLLTLSSCGGGSTGLTQDGQGGSSGAGGHGGSDEPNAGGIGAGNSGSSGGGAGNDGNPVGTGGTPATATGGVGGNATGGTAGKPPTGGAGGTPNVSAACGTLSACETFEDLADGAYPVTAKFKPGGVGSTFSVVSDKFKSGKKSIKVVSPKSSSSALLTLGNIAGITNGGGTVYARMMVFFAPSVIPTSRDGKDPHWRMLRMIETNVGGGGVVSAGVVAADRGRMLYIAADADCAADGGTVPANAWTCIEMRADAAGYQTWIDGKQAGFAVSTASGCWKKHTAVQSIGFGFELAAATRVRDDTFWMDDLAVSTKRIGCP